jgi:hypothetical protein
VRLIGVGWQNGFIIFELIFEEKKCLEVGIRVNVHLLFNKALSFGVHMKLPIRL